MQKIQSKVTSYLAANIVLITLASCLLSKSTVQFILSGMVWKWFIGIHKISNSGGIGYNRCLLHTGVTLMERGVLVQTFIQMFVFVTIGT